VWGGGGAGGGGGGGGVGVGVGGGGGGVWGGGVGGGGGWAAGWGGESFLKDNLEVQDGRHCSRQITHKIHVKQDQCKKITFLATAATCMRTQRATKREGKPEGDNPS